MISTPSSTRKLNLALRLFVWAKTAYQTILEKFLTTTYKALLRKLSLPIALVRLITKVTVIDIIAPEPNSSITFILNGCTNDPILKRAT